VRGRNGEWVNGKWEPLSLTLAAHTILSTSSKEEGRKRGEDERGGREGRKRGEEEERGEGGRKYAVSKSKERGEERKMSEKEGVFWTFPGEGEAEGIFPGEVEAGGRGSRGAGEGWGVSRLG